ncbi:bidirectional sugar transporter SWEET3a-like [Rosa chinensis]|uniref:bidirectional sugar transporter SWEET3a-like n=1 Tax=Rosa chinensis TaxID=74649 RepID=UPI001AD8DD15|nr:bidirectional sugar transporter SWEET3a-like [Rosa chinensis]XP_040369943.1 bidirectional sugar transporter SWEET3a-like [Rosa chinensis]XP_040369944.1 bidirectional sugar transporter SWEET3a-like [Rosa chinensis]XP_040369945.1 bidirectional sugar transporter SWEET3a-like [Rosa chinensis]XP_040369946.1 bidirectional sugar transporter SWEET3a-like [Rosa chinensis]XP_040369947.1 bidirectional sugar transporter SWEET3a-like [Rosa chinensis]
MVQFLAVLLKTKEPSLYFFREALVKAGSTSKPRKGSAQVCNTFTPQRLLDDKKKQKRIQASLKTPPVLTLRCCVLPKSIQLIAKHFGLPSLDSFQKLVIKTRSIEFMPFYLSLETLLMSLSFSAYGLFREDPFIYV